MRRIFVQAANQISLQEPLCESWMESPVMPDVPYARSQDPDFKQFVSPAEARRLGKVLKRALSVSLKTLRQVGVEHPDAIVTGTGLGSVESTEAFLTDMCRNGEHLLKPTHFMQSTHNTIGSLVAISTSTHGYNSTYSHKGISFQSALYDAMLQLRLGAISNALVGGHDGITDAYFHLLELVDYVGNGMTSPCGEVAMAAMLTTAEGDAPEADCLCELSGCRMFYKPSTEELQKAVVNMLDRAGLREDEVALMTGVNGKESNDDIYAQIVPLLFAKPATLRFKHLFGECFTSSALGFYAAAHMLHRGCVPSFMWYGDHRMADSQVRGILLLEKDREGDCSLMLLTRIP